jgi:hypothetical protein
LISDVRKLETDRGLWHAKEVKSSQSIAKMLALVQVDKKCLKIKTLALQQSGQ